MHQRYVAVCGASEATPSQLVAAREVGRLLARHGAVVINGGFGGVMGAASEGAASEGGTVVGILPDTDRGGANPHLTIALATGLGHARNNVIVTEADSLIPIGTRWATLSAVAIAQRLGGTVFPLHTCAVSGYQV